LVSGQSTADALISFSNFVHTNLDNNEKVLEIFLDLKKSFSLSWSQNFTNKLEYSGIRGKALKLFASYLSNRAQVVKIKNFVSR